MTTTLQEKKRILVLTPIYPADDIPKGWTPVVHYFTREWVKQGHRVLVVNYQAKFPKVFYWLARLLKGRITSKVGYTVPTMAVTDRKYQMEGVDVYRVCLKKQKPHSRYSQHEIKKALDKTMAYCKELDFQPDAVAAHWSNPQLELMCQLKAHFNVPTCYIAHDAGHFKEFGEDAKRLWDAVDIVGYRSAAIKRRFEITREYIKPSFMCYSGIPASYNDNTKARKFQDVRSIAYVGTLIKRKYPVQIITALTRSAGKDFCISYAGEGQEAEAIKAEAERLGVTENVRLLGRIDRNEVIKLLDETDLFIMISRNETFGLVYLEAMARGCITIASRNEGFDGIIEDGKNGFLCEAGNSDELAEIIERIKQMPPQQRIDISTNAMNTAKELTDGNVAAYYLEQIVKTTTTTSSEPTNL